MESRIGYGYLEYSVPRTRSRKIEKLTFHTCRRRSCSSMATLCPSSFLSTRDKRKPLFDQHIAYDGYNLLRSRSPKPRRRHGSLNNKDKRIKRLHLLPTRWTTRGIILLCSRRTRMSKTWVWQPWNELILQSQLTARTLYQFAGRAVVVEGYNIAWGICGLDLGNRLDNLRYRYCAEGLGTYDRTN